MKLVKFTRPVENYAKNDIAQFEDKVADALVEQDYAIEAEMEDTIPKVKKTK